MPKCEFCNAKNAKVVEVKRGWYKVCDKCLPEFSNVSEFSDFSLGRTIDAFEYLDDLRKSGVTNMFGASEYLEQEWAWERAEIIEEKESEALLRFWMSLFGRRQSAQERGG